MYILLYLLINQAMFSSVTYFEDQSLSVSSSAIRGAPPSISVSSFGDAPVANQYSYAYSKPAQLPPSSSVVCGLRPRSIYSICCL